MVAPFSSVLLQAEGAGSIIWIAVTVIIIGVIGYFIYKRRFGGRALGRGPGRYQRMTREGEPLEDYRGEGGGLISRSSIRVIIPVIIGFIILVVVLAASIK
ncbi:MAG: hypothetical protein M3M84_02500, partial [Thermoproteota archaeon]|nr:hypothetical protein [Thermoproteota archaeon]